MTASVKHVEACLDVFSGPFSCSTLCLHKNSLLRSPAAEHYKYWTHPSVAWLHVDFSYIGFFFRNVAQLSLDLLLNVLQALDFSYVSQALDLCQALQPTPAMQLLLWLPSVLPLWAVVVAPLCDGGVCRCWLRRVWRVGVACLVVSLVKPCMPPTSLSVCLCASVAWLCAQRCCWGRCSGEGFLYHKLFRIWRIRMG